MKNSKSSLTIVLNTALLLTSLSACQSPKAASTAAPASVATPTPTTTSSATVTATVTVATVSSPSVAVVTSEASDRCTNALGSGAEVISGPSEAGPNDFDSTFDALAIHPSNPNIIWVGTERNGIIKGEFNTSTREWNWQRSRKGLRHSGAGYPEIYSLAVSESDPQVLFAATVDGPGPLTEDDLSISSGVYKSIDGGENWFRMNCGLLNGRRVTAITFAPGSAIVAFAVVSSGLGSSTTTLNTYFEGGIYRTDDGGTNWTLVSNVKMSNGASDSRRMLSRDLGEGRSGVFTFNKNWTDKTKSLGLLRSLDLGQTFETITSTQVSHAAFYAFDVSQDGQVIVGSGGVSGSVISKDSGATWSSFPNGGGSSVAVSPSNPNIVLQSGGSLKTIGTITRVTDAQSVTPKIQTVFSGAPNTIDVVRFSVADPQIVYAVSKGYHVYRSEDAGATWAEQANLRDFISANQ